VCARVCAYARECSFVCLFVFLGSLRAHVRRKARGRDKAREESARRERSGSSKGIPQYSLLLSRVHQGQLLEDPAGVHPPPLPDHVLQAAEHQRVHAAAGHVHLEEVLLLRGAVRLAARLELPLPEATPGGETFRVGPAYLPAVQAQVAGRVLHHQVRGQRSEAVAVIHYPAAPAAADLQQAVVADLALVQVDDAVVLLVDGPVRRLRGRHQLQQVPGFAHGQQRVGRVHVQVLVLPELGEDAFLGAEGGVLHLADG